MVTGASSGIGAAIAQRLSLDGVDLILVGRNTEALELVAEDARSVGVRADILSLDLSSHRDVDRAVACLSEATPVVDLLVNNAGLGQWGTFIDLPIGRAIETIQVNCEALVRLSHAAAIRMEAAGHGSIIQVSSTAGSAPGQSQAVYAASKAFVSSFGQALAAELESSGAVTCTTVLPSYTRTRFFDRFGYETNDVPAALWMSAEEVAEATLEAARAGKRLVHVRREIGGRTRKARGFAGRVKRRLARA
jgi:short-subunit dehydrogenase